MEEISESMPIENFEVRNTPFELKIAQRLEVGEDGEEVAPPPWSVEDIPPPPGP